MIIKMLQNNKKGFTLIELVVAITLLGIIGGVVGHFVFSSYLNLERARVKSELHANAKSAIEKIVDDVRKSKSILIYDGNLTDISIPNTNISTPGTDATNYATTIKCEDENISGKYICYRLYTDSDSKKKLLRYINDNGLLPDPNPEASDDTSDVINNVSDFKIWIEKKEIDPLTDYGVILYSVKLSLNNGASNEINKIEAEVVNKFKKYRKPI